MNDLDVAIFGGGAAGLWLLDHLARRGDRVLLLESRALGAGQTVASQGILHGGFKYTLDGLLSRSAAAVRNMPQVWRDSLAGSSKPDLSRTVRRSDVCYLWQTGSIASRLGMIGARYGLRVAPTSLDDCERPPALSDCPGMVARIEEQVISPASFVGELGAVHRERILQIDATGGLGFTLVRPGQVESIQLVNPHSGERLTLSPRKVVLAAGAGNAGLRESIGLSADLMQRRPLHMVMLRGNLPRLNGHCVDGSRTRVTITSDVDTSGTTIWQVGGEVAERGIAMDEASLILHARRELESVIPALDFGEVEWATYRIDRAEARTGTGTRPNSVTAIEEGNTITAWPTKLVLAPALAEQVAGLISPAAQAGGWSPELLADWPRPDVALLPWQATTNWRRLDGTFPVDDTQRKVA